MRKIAVLLFALIFVQNLSAQNKFEGYNIILEAPEDQKQPACAIRYVPPTTEIKIVDLNRATPTKISPCAGSTSRLAQTSLGFVVRASETDFKWCFQAEDKRYQIKFKDISGKEIVYNWIATPENPGIYNVKDFGAVGDGVTDDTTAIKSALAFIATRNGGTLQFPEGDFVVTSSLVLPPGITIQGIGSLGTGSPTNNVVQRAASRIKLRRTNTSIFRIGECTERVQIRDIELYAESNDKTIGIEAVGAYNSSQDFFFERVTFNNFFRGIYVRGLPQTNRSWQFDYIKVRNCRFIYNTDAGIYSYTRNAGWKIEGCIFLNPKRTESQKADSMTFWHAGFVLIQDTFGGGFSNAKGGIFINIIDSSNVTVIGSQTESMTYSFVYNEPHFPYHGDYSYPITFVNNIFGDPIEFRGRRTFVSIGNLYGPRTFVADPSVRVYSIGDRFCYDGNILGCQGATQQNGFDKATVIMMAAQPDDGSVKGNPTFFGTDVKFGAPIQAPSFKQENLPKDKPNGSLVYCENCQRSTTPCRSGGSGAPAMMVAGQWSCF
jgi:hypothetical protein